MGFKFGAVLSSSYWPSGSNGWQSLYFRVTASYRLFGDVFVEPFVGLHWLGERGAWSEPCVWKNFGERQPLGDRSQPGLFFLIPMGSIRRMRIMSMHWTPLSQTGSG